jgi:predicted Fe-S protein YdhL (DUF1289 family)
MLCLQNEWPNNAGAGMLCETERRYLLLSPEYDTKPGVPSPCLSVCRLDPASGWCTGCLRTLDEITDWRDLSDNEKRYIWKQLPQRFDLLFPDAL